MNTPASGDNFSDLKNRLLKKQKQLEPWAKDLGLEAYRLYHWDIPEYPFYIDRYGKYIVIWDRSEDGKDHRQEIDDMLAMLESFYQAQKLSVIIKRRFRQNTEEDGQYTRQEPGQQKFGETMLVQERKLQFVVNLHDYVDTGLFLDHRPLRQQIFKQSKGKRVLNLFCYSGSLSVAAAAGGAVHVNSVDLNPNYLDWARENFKANKLSLNPHLFTRADILYWLQDKVAHDEERYDVIILDPPTFSNSKRTPNVLDIELDHAFMIEACLARLTEDGVLYFSSNKRQFKIDPQVLNLPGTKWRDDTEWSIPRDFDGVRPHRLWTCLKSSQSEI
jgi:23S rRNA (cytosine1962-C5)-methyltransferase